MPVRSDFINELGKRFAGDLRLDPASRVLYSTDASMYQIEPLGVAIPKTQDDLQAVVEIAAQHRIPILPRGAGSSLAGQAIGEALILDCSRWLDSIIEIDPGSRIATVEPGVVLSTLNRAAAKYDLMFGPDPASAERATMGGVIANNATGAHSILYGMSADHLISADVILADGSLETWDDNNRSILAPAVDAIRKKYSEAIKKNSPKSWRNSAGYRLNYLLPWSPSIPPQWDSNDYGLSSVVYRPTSPSNLASLLAGSEGTLAVIRRAQVNLVPKPKHTILGVLGYGSIVEACDDVPRLLEFKPSAIELIPRMILHLARGIPAYASQMGWVMGNPAAVLVVEFSGDRLDVLKEAVRRLGDIVTIAESLEEQARVWNVRKVGLGILDSRPQSARPAAFIEDCAIPIERLGEFVRETERILTAHNTTGGIYAHASAGCLHTRPILDMKTGEGVRAFRSIGEQILALTLRLGGSMSSEHGDGIARGEWLKQTYGEEVIEAMRMLKHVVDPHNLLNPGKLFDAPPMDTNLRYGENYRAQAWSSSLYFEHQHGLSGAIEQCNGQGVCRKNTGVMCPSFQATREEALSTRGRANLLRAIIAQNQLRSTDKLRDAHSVIRHSDMIQATYHSLDLCLACKGCTSECPSGVDMPKLKYEFMNTYYKSHHRPIRDYLFGYFHVVAKLLSPFSSLANAFMQMSWSRSLIAHSLGITVKRPFPIFKGAVVDGPKITVNVKRKSVLFLSDVFSRYIEPDVEQAAFNVLHTAGYDVKVLPIIGAGASLLSKGFIDAARRHAAKVLDSIRALDAEAGLSLVGCEPSEIYCLKHEYLSLLPERRVEIESIVERVWLLDEFLLRLEGFNDLRVATLDSGATSNVNNRKITIHPHCHQQAEGLADDGLPIGAQATVALLNALGFDASVTDAGCCGMAGTFGYDAEHYELSMQVGDLKLFPIIRKLEKSNMVVATGAACRMQIKQGTGVFAKHPILLVAEVLSRS